MSTVRYFIRHRTAYSYSGRIDLCHSLAHLRPREDEGLELSSHQIVVTPEPRFQRERTDYFGNRTNYFAIQQSHEALEVIATTTVIKPDLKPVLPVAGVAWDKLRVPLNAKDLSGVRIGNYLLPTLACPNLPVAADFLRPSLTPGRDVMELVNEVMGRVFREFQYVPGATDTTTPLEKDMKQRQGVCQDFAHVMISTLRPLGIPIRYVSGYLETLPPPGQKKLQGADATHAWIEAYAPSCGWVGFDPTNNKIPAGQHIKICHGRDYFDVQPLKGIFLGTGTQDLVVQVDVERM
ncbi:MAG TPA: transglutaminase family protein [Verrucomicrobiales bacterium]|nr:transglutaminase family protein [Verrucomicrobiales bacterium]